MIRTLSLALLLCALPLQAAEWRTDPANSRLGFSGSAQGESFEGRFGEFTPSIVFNPDDLAAARFDVVIRLASADTANAERDEALHSHDFFSVRRHPEARFVAERFRALGDGRFAADGELSLRGATRPVTLEFAWSGDGDTAELEGRAVLDRLDFDVGGGEWADEGTIARRVVVTTRLALRRAD